MNEGGWKGAGERAGCCLRLFASVFGSVRVWICENRKWTTQNGPEEGQDR